MSFASPVFRNRFSLFKKKKKNKEEIKKDLVLLKFQILLGKASWERIDV